MSEETPQRNDSRPPAENSSPGRPGFGAHLAGGIGLAVLSIVCCFPAQSIVPAGLFALGSLVSLAFPGRRGIAAGFFLTFGVLILLFFMICGTMLSGL